ncbi:uncharacterized protein LOC126905475 [Daktulosphaira vitifoliae]|uniref:uncharacterized protein LOC126905475 n=1 Tax=Daktulosphaira vitifoliae TaxID=58002 RepID=UPI0021A9AEC0|nr:uncharacterized protein LOC126905475 [Daktulosphaira vitifoliae]
MYYFYSSVFFLITLAVRNQCSTHAIQEESSKGSVLFIKHLNKIPTWEDEHLQFSDDEIKELLLDVDRNNNEKYVGKVKALKCIYGYAVQNILSNLVMFPTTEKDSFEDSEESSQSKSEMPGKKKKKRVTFCREAKLITIVDNDRKSITDILKETPEDLTSKYGQNIRMESFSDIARKNNKSKMFIVDTLRSKDLSSKILDRYVKYLRSYKKSVGRMLSVMKSANEKSAYWLWLVFIKLCALEKNFMHLGEFYQFPHQIRQSIDNLVQECQKNRYLEQLHPNKISVSRSELYRSVNQSFSFLKKLKLESEEEEEGKIKKENDLIELFKYEHKFEIFDLIWHNKIGSNIFPDIDVINWNIIDSTMLMTKSTVRTLWKKDPNTVFDYYDIVSDVIKVTLLYYSLKHFITFKTNRCSFETWLKIITSKKSFEKLQWYLTSPLSTVKKIVNFLDIQEDSIYTEIIKYMQEEPDRAKLKHLIKEISEQLQVTLSEYQAYDGIILTTLQDQESINIFDSDECECSIVLTNYYNTLISIFESFNFYEINQLRFNRDTVWIV